MNSPDRATYGGAQAPLNTTRRHFLQTTAIVASAFTVVPRQVLGGSGAPSNKLNIAGIGVGGMGAQNLKNCAAENIVALCDVDAGYAAKTFQTYPNAKVYSDYRVMFEKQKDIDALIVATPDHWHALIALAAIRAGKHVYVQKPMTHSLQEARVLTEAARAQKVATQMGNQGHSGDGTRLICEWIQSGTIGAVREIHAWTNRPVWPQGVEVERPAETPPVPEGLNWDMWVGPAPYRPYHPAYVPGTWRAWWDFGTGSLGDLGCHILDAPFWALNLKYPSSVEGCISTYWQGLWKKTDPRNENYPRSTIVRYRFPARGDLPPLKLTWWDGGMMPPRPEGLEPDEELGRQRRRRGLSRRQGSFDLRLLRAAPARVSGGEDARFAAETPNLGPDSRRDRWPRKGLGAVVQRRRARQLEFRLLRSAHRDGADGQPGGAFSQPAVALGRPEPASHQRQGRQCVCAAEISRGLDTLTVVGKPVDGEFAFKRQ